jgi:hypothetical protein
MILIALALPVQFAAADAAATVSFVDDGIWN